MKFGYKKYGKGILRPVIPITLKSGDEAFDYEVLVDSGADFCIFSEEIGEALGIDMRSGKADEVFGIGGKASIFYMHPVTFCIGGWEYGIEAGFMPTVGGKTIPYGIVGQKGFFDLFVVKFDLSKEQVELKERTS